MSVLEKIERAIVSKKSDNLVRINTFRDQTRHLYERNKLVNISEKQIDNSLLLLLHFMMQTEKISKNHVARFKQIFSFVPNYDLLTEMHRVVFKIKDTLSFEEIESIMAICTASDDEDDGFYHDENEDWGKYKSLPDYCYITNKKAVKNVSKSDKINFKVDQVLLMEGRWLENELKQANIGWDQLEMSLSLMNETVFDILMSDENDHSIQNDLLNFLGFNNIELISKIVKYRKLITLNVRMQNGVEGDVIDVDSDLFEKYKSLKSDIFKRMKRDIFMDKKDDSPPINIENVNIDFPNVYDSTKKLYSFGKRVCLPENAMRSDNVMYEQISIPPVSQDRPQVDMDLIKTSSLDVIGKKVFAHLESFNLVQSMVLDAAYNCSENLLICAPTGAGKTNVALLCIVQCINRFLSEGQIEFDNFKIVYVAPMKALAKEITQKFSLALKAVNIKVREYTGDMNLAKWEILETQVIVTTPEKWDVITRRNNSQVPLADIVSLIIFDEIHLLNDERGTVIESIVARTLRQVESSQRLIRLVGLSATLPNYVDVATFLKVNLNTGLFFFDERFRPVPLHKTFIGVKGVGHSAIKLAMNKTCVEKCVALAKLDEQIIVFVHSRNETVNTAWFINEQLSKSNVDISTLFVKYAKNISPKLKKSSNINISKFAETGILFHNASLPRRDRNLIENEFKRGTVRILVSTATLAWGVNLPCHAVIIKGTVIYDNTKGKFIDISELDVNQIFGRAGRPQYDTLGEAFIICEHNKLKNYVDMCIRSIPIESRLLVRLVDNLNAEIVLGTITTVSDAVQWMSYTFLMIRMQQNPLFYGISYENSINDPQLEQEREKLVVNACKLLDDARMVRYVTAPGYLFPTELGQIAAHHYLNHKTVISFNSFLTSNMEDLDVIQLISRAEEFQQLIPREEEQEELIALNSKWCCPFPLNIKKSVDVSGASIKVGARAPSKKKVKSVVKNSLTKVAILIQCYISGASVGSFSLSSDLYYISQNIMRVTQALFKIVLSKGWPHMIDKILKLSKGCDHKTWYFWHPLRQFPRNFNEQVVSNLEYHKLDIETINETSASEIDRFIRMSNMGADVKIYSRLIPKLEINVTVKPISESVLRLTIFITPSFTWNSSFHNKAGETFILWVEDRQDVKVYHYEFVIVNEQMMKKKSEPIRLEFCIPIFEPLPPQYYLHACSEKWLGRDTIIPINFRDLILNADGAQCHTKLLDLSPLPTSCLNNTNFQNLYNFVHFNAIQTQIFHVIFHSDRNVLIGAPTGSGKTVAAELAIFRVFAKDRENEKVKRPLCVYIAPMKALVRERVDNWKKRIGTFLCKNVVELTGDVNCSAREIEKADVIVTTPEKWDGITRNWKTRSYVQRVELIVIDEIHLIGEDRGPVLEFVVSRANFIASKLAVKTRIVGLSTALSNASDVATWLNIEHVGLYNFRPSVRPVPLEVHIQGFPGRHYCPRMATMNRPCFRAIETHSPTKATIIFVASRRQTRITAFDLIAYLSVEKDHKKWLNMENEELHNYIDSILDSNLKNIIQYGIGLHHAGLCESDRKIVEYLFLERKIQVLVATCTLAWGINIPCHLVIVKGTEYYDGKTHLYVDFPITDVLQMIGRAGRPQFDNHGVAVVMVQESKKDFYKKFLYEPFPVESQLPSVLADHLNAEIASQSITNLEEALKYISMTFFFVRLCKNPSYYGLHSTAREDINKHVCDLIVRNIYALSDSKCISIENDQDVNYLEENFPVLSLDINDTKIEKKKTSLSKFSTTLASNSDLKLNGMTNISCTPLGYIASFYYISHMTVSFYYDILSRETSILQILDILSHSQEFSEMPVRHNEDVVNENLSKIVPHPIESQDFNSSHVKVNLLLQAHLSGIEFEVSDYNTDLKSVLDQFPRLLQALLDTCALKGYGAVYIKICYVSQMVKTCRWMCQNCEINQVPNSEKLKTFSSIFDIIDILDPCIKNNTLPKSAISDLLNYKIDVSATHAFIAHIPQVDLRIFIDDVNIKDMNSQWIDKTCCLSFIIHVQMRFKHLGSRLNTTGKRNAHSDVCLLLLSSDDDTISCTKKSTFSGSKLFRGGFFRQNENLIVTLPAKNNPISKLRIIYHLNILHTSIMGFDQMYKIYVEF